MQSGWLETHSEVETGLKLYCLSLPGITGITDSAGGQVCKVTQLQGCYVGLLGSFKSSVQARKLFPTRGRRRGGPQCFLYPTYAYHLPWVMSCGHSVRLSWATWPARHITLSDRETGHVGGRSGLEVSSSFLRESSLGA